MKKWHQLSLFFLLTPLFPPLVEAQYESCGNDFNCYYERKAQIIEKDRQQQKEELQSYRNQQIELQKAQLEEIQNQNAMLEEQLRTLNARQGKLETLQSQQLDELKKQTPAAAVEKQAQEATEEEADSTYDSSSLDDQQATQQ
jgi:predicted nuclease with TOPRIM domain